MNMQEIILTAEQPIQGTIKKMRVMSHLVNLAVYVLIVAGIVFGLPNFLVWKLHTTYPMAAITSGSMWPVLKEGDLVFIEGVVASDIHVGDIIVYQNTINHTLTIHRVTKLLPSTLTTKGDANFSEDLPVSYDNVIGRTYNLFGKPLHIHYLGSITEFANNIRQHAEQK